MESSHKQSSNSPDLQDDAQAVREQFDVVKLDYERTAGLISSVSSSRMALRTLVATAYAAFLGLAVEQKSTALASAAAGAALAAGMYDIYLGWVYAEALKRAAQLERLFQHRMWVLDRSYDPFPVRRMRVELDRYQFGLFATFPRFHLRLLRGVVRPSAVAAYLALSGVAIAAAAVV